MRVSTITLEHALTAYVNERIVPHLSGNPLHRMLMGGFLKRFRGNLLPSLFSFCPAAKFILSPDSEGYMEYENIERFIHGCFETVPQYKVPMLPVIFEAQDGRDVLEYIRRTSGSPAPTPTPTPTPTPPESPAQPMR